MSNWLRPDAATSPERSLCHCYGRGKNSAQMIPGWPYSLVAALEPGRTPWTRLLDAIRLRPDDDLAAVTAAQVREVVRQVIPGWTRPRLRDPDAADRWTWLILAAYAQLWLARPLATGLLLPWQQPAPRGRLTPARVRQGFRAIHGTLPRLAAAPKPGKPGPGRPPGSKNRRPATRHDVGKTTSKKAAQKTTRGPQVKQRA